jgi:HAD superfamily hydrolase (TIGR01509 family)
MSLPAALIDVDGTLVDTNYHHVIAWYRAFRRHGVVLPLWRLHRHMGMGGDLLVPALAGKQLAKQRGDAIRAAEKEEYAALIAEVEPLPAARELLLELRYRGHPTVLVSSAKAEEVDHYLDLLDARELVDGWTTSADVEKTKPEPDLVMCGLEMAERAEGDRKAVMIGDSTWDIESAVRAGVETVAVLTGGYSAAELEQAGALMAFTSLKELIEHLAETPLADSR